MKIFGTDKLRGCYHNIDITTFSSMGARIILPVDLPTDFTDPTVTQDNMLVTSFSYVQRDKFSVVQCFNDVNHVYAFGHDPVASTYHVELMLFLVDKGAEGPSNALPRCLQAWAENRLYKSLTPTTFKVGDAILKGYMVGNQSSTADPIYNLQTVSYDFVMTSVQGENGPPAGAEAANDADRAASDAAEQAANEAEAAAEAQAEEAANDADRTASDLSEGAYDNYFKGNDDTDVNTTTPPPAAISDVDAAARDAYFAREEADYAAVLASEARAAGGSDSEATAQTAYFAEEDAAVASLAASALLTAYGEATVNARANTARSADVVAGTTQAMTNTPPAVVVPPVAQRVVPDPSGVPAAPTNLVTNPSAAATNWYALPTIPMMLQSSMNAPNTGAAAQQGALAGQSTGAQPGVTGAPVPETVRNPVVSPSNKVVNVRSPKWPFK